MRIAIAAAVTCLSIIGVTATAQVHAAIRQHTEIQVESLDLALHTLAKERGFQLVYLSENVEALQTRGAIGELTVDEALKALLSDSDLEYKFVDANTVSIFPRMRRLSPLGQTTSAPEDTPGRTSKRASGEYTQLAQANQGAAQKPSAVGSDAESTIVTSESSAQLTEILVTAQKRTERQQDVPIAMTVLDPQALAENGQNRLVDYFTSVPGLNLASNAFSSGTQYLTIRGLSAGYYQNPTVAVLIDDIPVASSTVRNGGSFTQPDLDPSDLTRIEVLKGPQGTLYGADSLGGLIKYVTTDPSTRAFSGRAEASGVDVPGGGTGYAVRGAVNIPVSDQFAFRASGFYRQDPGYIDDLTTGESNFNSSDTYGGRIAGLWRPSDSFSVKLSALAQNTSGDVSAVNSDVTLQFPQGDLKHTGVPGTSKFDTELYLYSAVLDAKVAGLDITSVTGYSMNRLRAWTDDTTILGPFIGATQNIFFPGVTEPLSVAPRTHWETDKFTQELRFGSSVGNWLDWRVGGFYTHEDSPDTHTDVYAVSLATGSVVGSLLDNRSTTITFSESALFADFTAHITDRLDVGLGGRQGWNRYTLNITDVGPAVPIFEQTSSPHAYPTQNATGNAFTYQFSPKYKISPELMVYGRIASGYRVGGSNAASGLATLAGVPANYAPDKTLNYELGIKGDLWDHHFSFDVAAYYIDWKNFQITLNKSYTLPGSSQLNLVYTSNAGNAKSEGVEFSFEARPVQGLTITAQGSYDNAVLTQDLPAASTAFGLAGDQLPYSARFSGGLAINQDIRLSDNWGAFFGGNANYIDSRPYEFTSPGGPPRIVFPAYTQLNLHLGVRRQAWTVNFYMNNVTDRRAVVGMTPTGGYQVTGGYYATVIQPRTIGLGVATTF